MTAGAPPQSPASTRNPYRIQIQPKQSSPISVPDYSTRVSAPRVFAIVSLWMFLLYSLHNNDSTSFDDKQRNLRVSSYAPKYRSSSGQMVTPPLKPLGMVLGETELFYMMPIRNAVGIMVFFHGCEHTGQDMFMMPEHRIVALDALNRGLVVVSISASDRSTGCWSDGDVEILKRDDVINRWLEHVELDGLNLPLMAMGVSSGAAIIGKIYKDLEIKSIAAYASATLFSDHDVDAGYAVPTVFVDMPRDSETARKVQKASTKLARARVSSVVLQVKPHPFTPDLCGRRIPELGDRRCQHLVHSVMIHQSGLLDPENFQVQQTNSRGNSPWDTILEEMKLDDELRHYIGFANRFPRGTVTPSSFNNHSWIWAGVEEVVAASFAKHEMTAVHRGAVLDFLMENAGIIGKNSMERSR